MHFLCECWRFTELKTLHCLFVQFFWTIGRSCHITLQNYWNLNKTKPHQSKNCVALILVSSFEWFHGSHLLIATIGQYHVELIVQKFVDIYMLRFVLAVFHHSNIAQENKKRKSRTTFNPISTVECQNIQKVCDFRSHWPDFLEKLTIWLVHEIRTINVKLIKPLTCYQKHITN